jgi:sporulation protein YlmC with PRC-barrel domain
MQFRQNAGVHTADGKVAGRIDRVVLDPKTKEVTHIVVRKGFLFTDDKVIPMDLIDAASEAGVMLRENAGDLQALPLFEETHHVRAAESPPTQAGGDIRVNDTPSFYWYPLMGGVPPIAVADPLTPGYVAETEQNIPEGTVALKEGAKVIAADGQHVGNVEQVITDPRVGRIMNLVISQGILVKERRQVPFTWVSTVREHEVHLTVASQIIDELGFMPTEN